MLIRPRETLRNESHLGRSSLCDQSVEFFVGRVDLPMISRQRGHDRHRLPAVQLRLYFEFPCGFLQTFTSRSVDL
jgi:hypothetical protein